MQIKNFFNTHKKKFLIGAAALVTSSLVFLIIKKASNPAKKLLKLASKNIGILEVGSNAGFSDSNFEKKIKQAGWLSGQDWCCYTVKTFLSELAKDEALDFFKKNINGSTQSSWKNLQTESKYHKISTSPQPGALIFYQNNSNTSKGHVEIIEKINNDGSYQVISGNSSISGSGKQGITRKTRAKSGISGFKILGYVIIKKLK